MTRISEGRAWVFGDHVNTDQILPGKYLDRPMDDVGQYAMAGLDDAFRQRVRPGDFIVAGVNFGCGSSREAAVMALKQAGVAAVIARSFGRIFFRNAINNGFPAAVVEDTARIAQGDPLRFDLEARRLTDLRTGEAFLLQNLTGISQQILAAGGIVPFTMARLGEGR